MLDLGAGSWTDDALVNLMLDTRVAKVAIDAPFGWPVAFIDAITTYRDGGRWLQLDPTEIRFRATEIEVHKSIGQWPLAVAMSDLAWPAMRCARLLALLDEHGANLDRSGRGLTVEVYPMAALRKWGIVATGTPTSSWSYKGSKPERRLNRSKHLAALRTQLAERLHLSPKAAQRFADDDNDFDALISALMARLADCGQTEPIPAGMQWLALREGWIHLPTADSLAQLN